MQREWLWCPGCRMKTAFLAGCKKPWLCNRPVCRRSKLERKARMIKDIKLDMDDFIAIAKALSDSHRVRALMALRGGELCVCQIIELLALAASTVSKHMSILKRAGLVDSKKDRRWVYYRLTEVTNRERKIDKIIKLSISLLKHDGQIRSDDTKMAEIASEGLETLCKRQRSTSGR